MYQWNEISQNAFGYHCYFSIIYYISVQLMKHIDKIIKLWCIIFQKLLFYIRFIIGSGTLPRVKHVIMLIVWYNVALFSNFM